MAIDFLEQMAASSRERAEAAKLACREADLLARALAFHRQYDAAEAVAKEALSHFRQIGSPRGQAMAAGPFVEWPRRLIRLPHSNVISIAPRTDLDLDLIAIAGNVTSPMVVSQ